MPLDAPGHQPASHRQPPPLTPTSTTERRPFVTAALP